MKSSDFLASLYRDATGWLVLWRSDTKASTWLNLANGGWRASVDACVEATHVRGEEHDLYFGVSLQRERTAGRGDAAGAVVVPGVWADVDFGNKPNLSAAAAKKNYPPPEIASAVLGAMPALPTYTVATGGGLHAYWLFDKPFVIQNEDDRERIAGILKGWQGMLRAKLLKAGGYGIDSTFDLPRVLRVPGSVHTKHPGLVVTPTGDGLLQYSTDAMEGWLHRGVPLLPVDPTVRKAKEAEVVAEVVKTKPKKKPPTLQVNRDADPPGSKLYNLLEASPEFRKLWEGKTTKASPSEYDMSLANFAINAGWSDADAAALLVAFCRKQQPSHMDKLLRVTNGVQDYLLLTVGKAHDRRAADAAADAADLAIDELAVEVREASRSGREPDRDLVLTKVSQSLGVDVVGFRQVGRREEVYSLIVKDVGRKVREVVIGPASSIHSSPQKLVERIMAELGRHCPVTPKLKKEWPAIVAGLVSIREFHELAEMELFSRVQVVVEEHLRRKSGGYFVTNSDQRAMCISEGSPFVEDKYLFLYGPSLRKLAAEVDKAIANSDLFIGLKTLGFRQETVSAGRSSRSYWKGSPEGFVVAAPPDPRPLVMGGRDA